MGVRIAGPNCVVMTTSLWSEFYIRYTTTGMKVKQIDREDTAPRRAAANTRTNKVATDSGTQPSEQRESFTVDRSWGQTTVTTRHVTVAKENVQGGGVVQNGAAIAAGV